MTYLEEEEEGEKEEEDEEEEIHQSRSEHDFPSGSRSYRHAKEEEQEEEEKEEIQRQWVLGLEHPPARAAMGSSMGSPPSMSTSVQGLTLVHFPAQRKRFSWDRGCA